MLTINLRGEVSNVTLNSQSLRNHSHWRTHTSTDPGTLMHIVPHLEGNIQSCCPSGMVMLSTNIHSQIIFLRTTQPQIVCSRSWNSLAVFFLTKNLKLKAVGIPKVASWSGETTRMSMSIIEQATLTSSRHQTNKPNTIFTLNSITLRWHWFY